MKNQDPATTSIGISPALSLQSSKMTFLWSAKIDRSPRSSKEPWGSSLPIQRLFLGSRSPNRRSVSYSRRRTSPLSWTSRDSMLPLMKSLTTQSALSRTILTTRCPTNCLLTNTPRMMMTTSLCLHSTPTRRATSQTTES